MKEEVENTKALKSGGGDPVIINETVASQGPCLASRNISELAEGALRGWDSDLGGRNAGWLVPVSLRSLEKNGSIEKTPDCCNWNESPLLSWRRKAVRHWMEKEVKESRERNNFPLPLSALHSLFNSLYYFILRGIRLTVDCGLQSPSSRITDHFVERWVKNDKNSLITTNVYNYS